MVDFDVELLAFDFYGGVGGYEDWAVDGFVKGTVSVDFADAHGDSATDSS